MSEREKEAPGVAAPRASSSIKKGSASRLIPPAHVRQPSRGAEAPALEAALRYARLGYAVLPLAPGEKRPMGSLVAHGLREATRQEEAIRGWWERAPGAGVGILPPSEVLVLDCDSREAEGELFAAYPELAEAPRQRTPRGGCHVFLALPEHVALSTAAKALAGVDLRGLAKAYVVAAPTQLPQGTYRWEVPLLPPEALPAAPKKLLGKLVKPPRPSADLATRQQNVTLGESRIDGLLAWAAARVAGTPEGQRHNTLLALSRLLGGYAHLGLDPDRAVQVLEEAAVRAGLGAREARCTARDGVRYGLAAPLAMREEVPRRVRWATARRARLRGVRR